MKKSIAIFAAILVLGMFSFANAFELEGLMGVGAFVDYGIGFGDNFDDIELDEDLVLETSMGLSFGGQFLYGLTSNIGLAAIVDYQMISFDYSGEGAEGLPDLDGENFIIIMAEGMYFFNTEAQICPFVGAGPGYYMYSEEDADSHFGIHGTVGFFYMFQENMAFEMGGRFHMLFDSDDELDTSNTTYLDIYGGVKFFFGME